MADIVITGAGLVTPLGLNRKENARGLMQGRPARVNAGPFTRASGFEVESLLRNPRNAKFCGQPVRLAMKAASEAVASVGESWTNFDASRIALHLGSGETGLEHEEYYGGLAVAWDGREPGNYKYLGARASRLIDPYFSLRTLANAGAGMLSMQFGIHGPSSNFVQGELAGVQALQASINDLSDHRCDVALTGAYDSLCVNAAWLAYEAAGLLDVLSLAEGAAFVVLERKEDAVARGAQILGAIEAAECLTGDPELDRVGADFIIARNIGIPNQDEQEAGWIASWVGSEIPLTSLKNSTGYLGAATALAELVLGLVVSRTGCLPPARSREPYADRGLGIVTGKPFPLSSPCPTGLYLSSTLCGGRGVIRMQSKPN
jgi:3-oxoacyl-(acyl-carrier-protein) synthase